MQHSLNHATISPPPPHQFSANKRRNGLVGAVLATTLTAGIGSAVAQSLEDMLTMPISDMLIDFYRTKAQAAIARGVADMSIDMTAATSFGMLIMQGEEQLRNPLVSDSRIGCMLGGSRTARDCTEAVAEEFADLYINGNADSTAALNAELGVAGSETNRGTTLVAVRPAVERYYSSQFPPPADDDDAPWAEAIGGAIVLSYFANYLIKQTTWQGNLFTYAMPTSDDTFAYGVQFEPSEDWQMRFSVADSSYAETPADPYYRMQVEYRF